LPGAQRTSIEEETHDSFIFLESAIQDSVRQGCPNGTLCVNIVPQVDDRIGRPDDDCYVDRNVIPNPLYEHGTITVMVNNLCDPPSSG
jgi:hypothetical protein